VGDQNARKNLVAEIALLLFVAMMASVLLSGCTSLRITTPSGYEIKRNTVLTNRQESLVLYDPATGQPLGEYKRVDEGDAATMAIMADTIRVLLEKCLALQAAQLAGGV
jgi:hypothetical protein